MSDGSVNSAPLRDRAIATIEHDELRFKKQQFDDLISNANNRIEKLKESFNENLLAESLEHVRQLEQSLFSSKAEIAKLKSQLKDKLDMSADGLKEVSHQSYRTIDRVMYAMAELTTINNSAPYGQNKGSLNEAITTILERDRLPLGSEPVGKWLTRINTLKSVDKLKKEIDREN